MQIKPIKPMLKPPGTKHLKLNRSILLSTFAFNSNLRRYNMEGNTAPVGRGLHSSTFRLNVSAFCSRGGACMGCSRGV